MMPSSPPRSASWILSWLLPETDKEAVLGDLIEERQLRPHTSPNEAWWYWGQIARSLPPLLLAASRRGRWLGFLGAGVVAYLLVRLVESAGVRVVTRVFAGEPRAVGIGGIVLAVAAMVLGGYVATRMRRGAATVPALISIVSVLELMVRSAGVVPIWYSVVWLVICPVTAFTGSALARRLHPRVV